MKDVKDFLQKYINHQLRECPGDVPRRDYYRMNERERAAAWDNFNRRRAQDPNYGQAKIEERALEEWRDRIQYQDYFRSEDLGSVDYLQQMRARMQDDVWQRCKYTTFSLKPKEILQYSFPQFKFQDWIMEPPGLQVNGVYVVSAWTLTDWLSYFASTFSVVKYMYAVKYSESFPVTMGQSMYNLALKLVRNLYKVPFPSAVIGDRTLSEVAQIVQDAFHYFGGRVVDGFGKACQPDTLGIPVRCSAALASVVMTGESFQKKWVRDAERTNNISQWLGGMIDAKKYYDVSIPEWFQYVRPSEQENATSYANLLRPFLMPSAEMMPFILDHMDHLLLLWVLADIIWRLCSRVGYFKGVRNDRGASFVQRYRVFVDDLQSSKQYSKMYAVERLWQLKYMIDQVSVYRQLVPCYSGVWPRVGWSIITACKVLLPRWRFAWTLRYDPDCDYGDESARRFESVSQRVVKYVWVLRVRLIELYSGYSSAWEGVNRVTSYTNYDKSMVYQTHGNEFSLRARETLLMTALGSVLSIPGATFNWSLYNQNSMDSIASLLAGFGSVKRGGIKYSGKQDFRYRDSYRDVTHAGIRFRQSREQQRDYDVRKYLSLRKSLAAPVDLGF